MTTRGRILSFGSAALLFIAGVVSGALVGDGTGTVLAVTLCGAGLILATGFVFMEVGLSEERELEREAELDRRRRYRRLQLIKRMRGRPRRLR